MTDKYWVAKTLGGFRVESYHGQVIRFFSMAADCKAFCIDCNLETKYVSFAAPKEIIEEYENATGKRIPNPLDRQSF